MGSAIWEILKSNFFWQERFGPSNDINSQNVDFTHVEFLNHLSMMHICSMHNLHFYPFLKHCENWGATNRFFETTSLPISSLEGFFFLWDIIIYPEILFFRIFRIFLSDQLWKNLSGKKVIHIISCLFIKKELHKKKNCLFFSNYIYF